jgi:hypothetical protein
MPQPYVPPALDAQAFNCPLCHAYARQDWLSTYCQENRGMFNVITHLKASVCSHCHEWLYWFDDRIIVPDVSTAPAANEDLADDIKADYQEAASIASKSPRGAAALLRLCIQKLCKQLGEKGRNIDDDIAALVKKGLDIQIQQALDTVRVIGNEAVHPGEMDLRDDPELAGHLFELVNLIADQMITQPKKRAAVYARLPAKKLEAIERRDAKGKEGAGTE